MTKTLLERFIVHRPHPWGALVTFIELLRNPKYEFWSKEFVRVAPEVTMLLERVSLINFGTLITDHNYWQVARSIY
jgi:CCR4-NOT transcription complex subunit 1